jgi:hypothetical protein
VVGYLRGLSNFVDDSQHGERAARGVDEPRLGLRARARGGRVLHLDHVRVFAVVCTVYRALSRL